MEGKAMEHRDRMLRVFALLAKNKYMQGYAEHGGDLQSKSPLELLCEIRDEAIDTFIYVQTAIDKMERKK